MGCRSLLLGIFLTQGLNPGLLHCRQIIYHLIHQEDNVSYSYNTMSNMYMCLDGVVFSVRHTILVSSSLFHF